MKLKDFSRVLLGLCVCCGISAAFTSCGGSDDPEPDPTPTPSVTVSLKSQSIAEGSEVDAKETPELQLTYSTSVKLSANADITLNGTKLTASRNPKDVTGIQIPLSLEEGVDYTLIVRAGSVVANSDATASAPEFKLNFKTKPKAQPVNNDATALTKKLGWGWNLGNHFDTSTGEDGKPYQWGYWDNAKPTQTLYTNLKKAGASTVRIGVTWGNRQTGADWTIDADYMAEVRQNVEWAEAVGLNVILNTHHDEYWLDIKTAATNSIVNEQIKDRLQKTWKQIAEAFKDKGEFLFFETFNEVQDGQWGWGANRTDGGKQYRTLNEWNQVVVDAIRATGGQNATRWIGVPGYASSPTFVLDDNFVLPSDAANRLMVSVHFYDPSDFTLTPETSGKNQWGHTAEAGKSVADNNEEHVVDVFKKLQEKFILNNIPVYIGEYGCVMQTSDRSNKFRSYYLEYVCRAAHTYNLPVVIWDNNVTGGGNEHHGYFNHNDGTYLNNAEGLVQTMIRATTSDDADYTLESIYNKAP